MKSSRSSRGNPSSRDARTSRSRRIAEGLRLPVGALALVAFLGPAAIAAVLLEVGFTKASGGAIATGVLVGGFWLMLLIQTARTVTRERD